LAFGFPALHESAGSLKTRFAQTGQTPFSADSLLLGGVKWQKNTDDLMVRGPFCPAEHRNCLRNKNCRLETGGDSHSVFLPLKYRPLETLKPKK